MNSYQYNPELDKDFFQVISDWWPNDDVSLLFKNPMYDRYYIMWKYSKLISTLEGDFVECGVYNGSTANIMATNCNNTLHLFDSWEGLSELGPYDNAIYEDLTFGFTDYKFKYEFKKTKQNLIKHDNIKYYKGWIPKVLNLDTKISFLHLDLDLYQPTKDCLEYFWEKIIDGGIVLCDLHNEVSTGASKATKDFFSNLRDIKVLSTGQAIIKK
ncbi:MAG: TylF/MycF/NovP-related O-methyltransferase [Sediminibacterium sp.]